MLSSSFRSSGVAPIQNIPSWYLLLLGISLGYNVALSSGPSMEKAFATLQFLVNHVLAPLYSFCVFVYLARLIAERLYRTYYVQRKEKQKEASVLVALEELPEEEGEVVDDHDGHVNMNGSFRLVQNDDNYENFLATQGVPWALRRAANGARPIHTFLHHRHTLTIRIRGIIESSSTYVIGGEPVESNIRGRIFKDQVTYLETGDGIVTHKKAVTEDYDIVVERRLSSDRQKLVMTSRAVFRDGREPVEAIQRFERILQ